MLWDLLRRAVFSTFVLVLVTLVLFVLTRSVPGSPAIIVLGIDTEPFELRQFEHDHGLDRPIFEQYMTWFGNTIRGDLGNSYMTGLPLAEELAETFPITIELVVLSIIFAVIVGVPLGMVSAFKSGRMVDTLSRLFAVIGVSIPGFWLGLILIVYVSVGLGWLPPGGFVPISKGPVAHLSTLVLPILTLGLHYIAVLSRLTRSSMLDALSQDYIRTARAMGLSRWLVWLYALKNAAAPIVTVSAMAFGYSFGWALIIEHVFSIPGMSRALLNAIQERDYPTIQIIVLVITAVFIIANLVSDMLNRTLNPKLMVATQ